MTKTFKYISYTNIIDINITKYINLIIYYNRLELFCQIKNLSAGFDSKTQNIILLSIVYKFFFYFLYFGKLNHLIDLSC
jgi:hypothetical protein